MLTLGRWFWTKMETRIADILKFGLKSRLNDMGSGVAADEKCESDSV